MVAIGVVVGLNEGKENHVQLENGGSISRKNRDRKHTWWS